MYKLPAQGLDHDQLFQNLEDYRQNDLKWRGGRAFAYVYDAGKAAEEVGKRAYMMYLSENGLDPTAFPSLLRLENELAAIALGHLNAPADTGGATFTSGGTESIMLAVKSAREHARATRPQITAPELVLPTTAHAAFHKAARYLGLKVVLVEVDPTTFKPTMADFEAAFTDNTILAVGSAPSYAHGVIDPITPMAAFAASRGALFHVDACVGGWLLPFFRELGAEVPPFDFSVPGVTSMSMDWHKYAFAPKGASVVLYRDRALRQHQIFACSDWTGYTIINNAVQSSKTGGPMAAAWAVLHHFGHEGYLEAARRVLETTRQMAEGIEAIADLELLGKPEFCMLAFGSKVVNVFHIADEMAARGWHVQPQLAYKDHPQNIHLSIHPGNVHLVEPFLAALAESVEAARALPSSPMAAMLKDQVAAMDLSDMSPEMVQGAMAMLGVDGAALPERMAGINEVLNVLPPALADRMLTIFFNQLFTPAQG